MYLIYRYLTTLDSVTFFHELQDPFFPPESTTTGSHRTHWSDLQCFLPSKEKAFFLHCFYLTHTAYWKRLPALELLFIWSRFWLYITKITPQTNWVQISKPEPAASLPLSGRAFHIPRPPEELGTEQHDKYTKSEPHRPNPSALLLFTPTYVSLTLSFFSPSAQHISTWCRHRIIFACVPDAFRPHVTWALGRADTIYLCCVSVGHFAVATLPWN